MARAKRSGGASMKAKGASGSTMSLAQSRKTAPGTWPTSKRSRPDPSSRQRRPRSTRRGSSAPACSGAFQGGDYPFGEQLDRPGGGLEVHPRVVQPHDEVELAPASERLDVRAERPDHVVRGSRGCHAAEGLLVRGSQEEPLPGGIAPGGPSAVD